MSEAPAVQFCRRDQPNHAETAPDIVIGRLVARVAELEEMLYQNDLQDDAEGWPESGCA